MPGFVDHQNKFLHEVVFPGSHDAGVNAGGKNAKTQNLNLMEQCFAGCRYFDVRVAVTKGGEQKAFHADAFLVKGKKKDTQSFLPGGAWGDTFVNMLNGAYAFVASKPDEFVILRLSKSYGGWDNIVQTVINTIPGDKLWTGKTNLNVLRVSDLKGKVVVVFDEGARKGMSPQWQNDPRILFVRSLYSDGAVGYYDPNYSGLQYYGKFGATTFKPGGYDRMTKLNNKSQIKTLKLGQGVNREVLGMMYWTTTGLFQNIIKRNDQMWNQVHSASLKETWTNGLRQALQFRMNSLESQDYFSLFPDRVNGNYMKSIMPNIVMIDDVNKARCDFIWGLNDVAATELQAVIANEKNKQNYEKLQKVL